MKVNFILPFISKSGGVAVVLEYALRLRKRGHEVRIYYPLLPYGSIQYHLRPGSLKYWAWLGLAFFKNLRHRHDTVRWFHEPVSVSAVPMAAPIFIRHADATIATSWPTAFDVARLPPSKGNKYYFIQDYEIWNTDAAAVDETYRLPLKQIVIAPWLAQLMESKFGKKVEAEIHNGIDLDFFRPPAQSRDWSKPVIAMMYHTTPSKGAEDGLRVLERIRKDRPDVTIKVFGHFELPASWNFVEYQRNPSMEDIRALYRSAMIFICPSRSEGWGLPIMEAMACGCAVVTTKVGCVPVLQEGGNMLTAEPGDVDTLYRHALSLISDPVLCQKVADLGMKTISEHGWERPTAQLETLLLSSLAAA